jgi:hypothetical protein
VFLSPVVLLVSALVPPAVLPAASLGVEFGGGPPLAARPNSKTEPATKIAQENALFMEPPQK